MPTVRGWRMSYSRKGSQERAAHEFTRYPLRQCSFGLVAHATLASLTLFGWIKRNLRSLLNDLRNLDILIGNLNSDA